MIILTLTQTKMPTLKKTVLLITITLITLNIHSQNFNSPVEYLNFISDELNVITKNNWKYTKAIAHSKSDRNIRSKRNLLIKSIERALLKIKRANTYEGDEYKTQVINFLELNKNLMNQDYAKVIDMKEVAEQSYDAMEAYILAQELADKKMTLAQKEYESNFYSYANKHRIEIIESESDLGKKMEISNKVFKHYNDMHLVFFKVRINEIYLLNAIEKNDVSGIQQNNNALLQAAQNGIEQLKSIEGYQNDKSIIEATHKVFEFFIDEASNDIPKILDFFMLNSDFEKIKETLEKTTERKRTKEQINAYNKKVKEINNGINEYNKLNKSLFEKRQKAYNSLNAANESFLEKHIPKD